MAVNLDAVSTACCASKGGGRQSTKALVSNVRDGMRVNSAHPGLIETLLSADGTGWPARGGAPAIYSQRATAPPA